MDISVNYKLQHAAEESYAIECYADALSAEPQLIQFVALTQQSVSADADALEYLGFEHSLGIDQSRHKLDSGNGSPEGSLWNT
mmetsp:Transcript_17311/g.35711  ORF Transcript_17311/g.35711 Transcript_17311/m.35711 type:complete len:83 (+) Transcript_17311:409-657(+)